MVVYPGMPIVTLSWQGNVAYGPRGARYELTEQAGLHFCRVYSNDQPNGVVIAANEGTRHGAMLSAQKHCEAVTDQVELEGDAINGAAERGQYARR